VNAGGEEDVVNVGGEDAWTLAWTGALKITLALAWTVINHFSIEQGGISSKGGLLLWCQRQAQAYVNVEITNFAGSWKNGLAFCALLHRFKTLTTLRGRLLAHPDAGGQGAARRPAGVSLSTLRE
jgi:hypothetical protein